MNRTSTSARTQVDATPLVRRAAAQRGITLASLTGTGAGGRITLADVRVASVQRAAQRVQAATAQRVQAATDQTTADDELYRQVFGGDDAVPEADDLYAQVFGDGRS
jgi:pyruvate/2-oxoglutarate dehydrogenase complex dihydrolipoamide acyltransferase (E2) component